MENDMGGSVTTHCLSLRGGNGARDAAIHRVSRDAYDLSLRLLVHSGSPRAFSPRDDKILYAGATLAGMALLGCRPIGPGPPRSAWFSASAVILPSLAHCFWKPTRKPMLLTRSLGVMLSRLAERRPVPPLLQEPPRKTRCEPDAEPVGSITGLPVG